MSKIVSVGLHEVSSVFDRDSNSFWQFVLDSENGDLHDGDSHVWFITSIDEAGIVLSVGETSGEQIPAIASFVSAKVGLTRLFLHFSCGFEILRAIVLFNRSVTN